MATVRISGNWRSVHKMEWAGAPNVDKQGRIERTLTIPEAAYEAIEKALAKGGPEGDVYLEDGTRFHWFLDQ